MKKDWRIVFFCTDFLSFLQGYPKLLGIVVFFVIYVLAVSLEPVSEEVGEKRERERERGRGGGSLYFFSFIFEDKMLI